MPKPKTKIQFSALERVTWDKLNVLVDDLSDAAWRQPGTAGEWSPKDV